jgi:hypothetical protein
VSKCLHFLYSVCGYWHSKCVTLHKCLTDKRILFHWQVWISVYFSFNMLKYDVTNESNNGNKLFIIIFFKKLFSYQIVPRTNHSLYIISIFYSQTLKIHILKYKQRDMCHNSLLYLILFHFLNNTRNASTERQTFQKEVKVFLSSFMLLILSAV